MSWRPARAIEAMLLVLLVGPAIGLVGCTRPDRAGDDAIPGQPTELRWRPSGSELVCDGTDRRAGTVEQAEAGEAIDFTSPLPIEVPSGRADGDGHYTLAWTCQPEESQLRWELTATGADSGRTVPFTIVGAAASLSARPDLAVSLFEEAIVCDGIRREVGVVTGLEPDERVTFVSEQTGDALPRRADDVGTATFGLACRPGDVGRTWEVTAEAERSERSVTFELSGLASSDDLPLEVIGASSEVPCDGRVHSLATVRNLFPEERVTFTASPRAADLRDGRAMADGSIELRWQCDADGIGRTWDLTATAAETGKTVGLRFTGVAGQPAGEATVRLIEDPFVCDGRRRPVAELEDLVIGEYIDFTSPQADALREGRFEGGPLPVNWQCDAGDLDGAASTIWEVTATGRQSGRAATFTITGVAP